MLTAGEVTTIEAALVEAERGVETIEAAARESWNLLAWIGLPDETARRAQDRAEESRANLERMRARRVELFELPVYDHEAAAALVEYLRNVAANAPSVAAGFLRSAELERPLSVAGDVLADTARDLTNDVADARDGWRDLFRWLPWILVAVVVLAVVSAAATFGRSSGTGAGAALRQFAGARRRSS